nr:GDSL esterase/lipase At5g03610-like [Tanacetum cinerariifolium]
MGIKSPLPYRVTKYAPNKLRAGINFAFGGTGVFDTGNFQPNLTTQIGYLQGLIKDSVYTKRDLKSSLAMVTVSGNDYSAFTASGGSQQNLPAFITSVINQMTIDLKLIHDLGIPRVLVNTLQPVGCLPQLTIIYSYQQCNQTQNSLASFHNQLLQLALTTLNNNTKKSTFLPLDLFTSFNTVLKNKGDITGNLKFDTPLKPCCTVTTSTASCGSLDENGKPLYTVCSEPESMFFWDTVHPTQAGWRALVTLFELNDITVVRASRRGQGQTEDIRGLSRQYPTNTEKLDTLFELNDVTVVRASRRGQGQTEDIRGLSRQYPTNTEKGIPGDMSPGKMLIYVDLSTLEYEFYRLVTPFSGDTSPGILLPLFLVSFILGDMSPGILLQPWRHVARD